MFNLENTNPILSQRFDENPFKYAPCAINTFMSNAILKITAVELADILFCDEDLSPFDDVPTMDEIVDAVEPFMDMADKSANLFSFKPYVLYELIHISSIYNDDEKPNLVALYNWANMAQELENHKYAINRRLGDSDIFYKYLYKIYDLIADKLKEMDMLSAAYKWRKRAVEMIQKINLSRYIDDHSRYVDEMLLLDSENMELDEIIELQHLIKPDFTDGESLFCDIGKTYDLFAKRS